MEEERGQEKEVKTADEPKTVEQVDEPKTEEGRFSQQELDKIIAKRIERERGKMRATIQEEVAEAQRLANLSAEEKAQEIAKKQREQENERLMELEKKEMLWETKEQLQKQKLPVSLANFLVSEKAEQTLENIKSFKEVFETSLEERVNETLKSGYIPSKQSGGNGKYTKEQLDNMTDAEYYEATKSKED